MKDILRYTLTSDSDDLTEKTLLCIDKFNGKGYNTVEIKNYWLDDSNPYKGVNTVVRASDGQAFEVQYHTPESFALKNGAMHKLYEKQRLIEDVTSSEYINIRDEMFALSDKLSVPNDIERVKTIK